MTSTWATLGILAAGMVVVIGGILVLRLHAFLALIFGALLVSALTPDAAVVEHAIKTTGFVIVEAENYRSFHAGDGTTLVEEFGSGKIFAKLGPKQSTSKGREVVLVRLPRAEESSRFRVMDIVAAKPLGTTERLDKLAVLAPSEAAADAEVLQPGDIVIHPAALGSARSLGNANIGERVANGFGSTCASIGILIAMASIIGKCLLDSGAADRIVRTALGWFGERGAPLSFLFSGFLLGIPVFFDTVFYLMIPLGKALAMQTKRNYLLYVLSIVAGATMAHSLVPPTPGPLLVAEQLGIDMGVMILAGVIVGIFTAGFGYLYATVANRLWELPLRESPDFSLAELEEVAKRDISELPPFWLSLTPILLPVVLIGGYTILEPWIPGGMWKRTAATLGDKNIALVLAGIIAMLMLLRQKRAGWRELADSMQGALASGGVIILITAAGGAFGTVLQQTGVSGLIGELSATEPMLVVLMAFGITTAIRTAQGSATVAMITAVGILGGLSGELTFHPVYLALAIGCGSKPIAWMNDSGFWVITKMSGMTESEGLKFITPMTGSMGIIGLIVTLIGVKLFPLM
jgi:gluconate:H+ symporter, GntP family